MFVAFMIAHYMKIYIFLKPSYLKRQRDVGLVVRMRYRCNYTRTLAPALRVLMNFMIQPVHSFDRTAFSQFLKALIMWRKRTANKQLFRSRKKFLPINLEVSATKYSVNYVTYAKSPSLLLKFYIFSKKS